MKFRSTLILIAIFGALAGYVYYSEIRNGDSKQKAEDAKRKVFQFEGKDISEIRIDQDGATVARGARKGAKDWEISSPAGLEADSAEWDTLASHIAGLEKETTVEENAKDLDVFGLAKPAVQLFVKRTDGSTVEIGIGDENPNNKTMHYVKVSTNGDVFLSPNSITSFRKSLTDLRNKTVLDILPENIDLMTIVEGARKTTFRKSGDDWRIDATGLAPGLMDAKADSAEVSSFLGAVQFSRAAEFADHLAAGFDIKKTGLEPPTLQLTLHDSKASADRTLLIGKESGPEKYFAKDASRTAIFTLDKQLQEKMRRPLFDWRDKTVARVDREKVDEIEIARGAEKLLLKKSGTDWKLADGRKVQQDKILSIFDLLDTERAKDIVDGGKAPAGSGLDKPKMQATLRQGGKDVLALAFGEESKKPEGIYAKKAEGPAVMVLSKEAFEKLNLKADDIVEKKP